MMTVDVAYRISTHGDYAVANALCLVSLLFGAAGAWVYLRHAVKNGVNTRDNEPLAVRTEPGACTSVPSR